MIRRRTLLLAAPAIAAGPRTRAAEVVRVGALLPLIGTPAASGGEAKAAIEVAAEIINTGHPELMGLTVGNAPGLAGLGGARIEPGFVDHRGDPSMAQSLALKLITGGKMAALTGAYHSACAMTATAVSERYGVAFVVSDSVAANAVSGEDRQRDRRCQRPVPAGLFRARGCAEPRGLLRSRQAASRVEGKRPCHAARWSSAIAGCGSTTAARTSRARPI
ncbi:MAG TPA: ABC transporter substrate-binding protein [Rhodopila sp.]